MDKVGSSGSSKSRGKKLFSTKSLLMEDLPNLLPVSVTELIPKYDQVHNRSKEAEKSKEMMGNRRDRKQVEDKRVICMKPAKEKNAINKSMNKSKQSEMASKKRKYSARIVGGEVETLNGGVKPVESQLSAGKRYKYGFQAAKIKISEMDLEIRTQRNTLHQLNKLCQKNREDKLALEINIDKNRAEMALDNKCLEEAEVENDEATERPEEGEEDMFQDDMQPRSKKQRAYEDEPTNKVGIETSRFFLAAMKRWKKQLEISRANLVGFRKALQTRDDSIGKLEEKVENFRLAARESAILYKEAKEENGLLRLDNRALQEAKQDIIIQNEKMLSSVRAENKQEKLEAAQLTLKLMSEKELMTKEQLDRRKEVEVLKEKEKDLIMNKTTMEIEISVLRDKLNVEKEVVKMLETELDCKTEQIKVIIGREKLIIIERTEQKEKLDVTRNQLDTKKKEVVMLEEREGEFILDRKRQEAKLSRKLKQYKKLSEENMQRAEIKANMYKQNLLLLNQMKNEMDQNEMFLAKEFHEARNTKQRKNRR